MSRKVSTRKIGLSVRVVRRAIGLASVAAVLTLPVMGHAASFTLDGVEDGVNGNDMYTESWTGIEFWNGHKEDESRYRKGDATNTTTVRYGEGKEEAGGPTDYSWLLIEVPLYAKNMVWGDPAMPDDGWDDGAPKDFEKATGSEKLIFGATPMPADVKEASTGNILVDFGADNDFDDKSIWNVLETSDSSTYLLGEGSAECGVTSDLEKKCGAANRTMSFEIKLTALNQTEKTALKTALENNGVSFHLSPERNGTRTSEVPVPAAFWLFGTALIGFIGISRRTKIG